MAPAQWEAPAGWPRITTIDAHTEGEPFRVVTGGVPEIPGATILEKRRWAMEHLDTVRRRLMWEPRGHADMYGCFPTAPVSPGAGLGVLFLHNEGFSTMCGHGIIALVTVALETGMIPASGGEVPVSVDTPAGLVRATGHVASGRVRRVGFLNVPSFVLDLDQEVEVPGMGRVRYDLAFGGAFYAYVEAASVGLACEPSRYRALLEAGSAIKQAVMARRSVEHPFEEDLGFLYGVVFTGPASAPGRHGRNVCVFADGEVDRSPTGTSVSARMALLHARGRVGVGEAVVIESILGTTFTGTVAEVTAFGPHAAVVPRVEGSAHITGRHEFLFDPEDNLPDGFFLR